MTFKSDKQRRAAMANLRNANKARLDGHYKRLGGPVSAAEARARQAERGRAGKVDAARQGKAVLQAGSKRSALWRSKPGRYDLKGVDTPNAAAPKASTPVKVKAKAASKPEKQPESKAQAPKVEKPRKTRSLEERRANAVLKLKAREAALLPNGKGSAKLTAADREKATEVWAKHAGASQVAPSHTYGRKQDARSKAEEMDLVTTALNQGAAVVDSAHVSMMVDEAAYKKQGFDQAANRQAFYEKTGINSAVVPNLSRLENTFHGDLGAYIKTMDPQGTADYIPIKGTLYATDFMRQIAKAMPGEVTMQNGPDYPLVVRKGTLTAMLAPRIERDPAEDKMADFLEHREEQARQEGPRLVQRKIKNADARLARAIKAVETKGDDKSRANLERIQEEVNQSRLRIGFVERTGSGQVQTIGWMRNESLPGLRTLQNQTAAKGSKENVLKAFPITSKTGPANVQPGMKIQGYPYAKALGLGKPIGYHKSTAIYAASNGQYVAVAPKLEDA